MDDFSPSPVLSNAMNLDQFGKVHSGITGAQLHFEQIGQLMAGTLPPAAHPKQVTVRMHLEFILSDNNCVVYAYH